MMEKKICFKCRKEIEEDEHYFSFIEFNKKKEIKIDYAHKLCWDEIKSSLKVINEASGMLRGLKEKLKEQGILPPERVII